MKQQTISNKKLKTIRDSLPQGAMAKIARKLTTPELAVKPRDVYKVLSGKGIKFGKIDPNAIILEAIAIYKEVTQLRQEASDSIAEVFEATENH